EKLVSLGVKKYNLFLNGSSLNPFVDIVSVFHLFLLYFFIKPDVVCNFTPKLNVYSSLVSFFYPKIKVINNISGLGSAFVSNNIKKSMLHILYKITQRRADIIFFQNNDDLSYFLEHRLVQEIKTRCVIGSGVDINKFKVTKIDREKCIKFILVARLIEHKGIRLYVEAARIIKSKYPFTHFALLGPSIDSHPSSINLDEVHRWTELGYIDYLGHSDDVANVIADFDCVVLPSYYREGVPKSLLEAAASGKIIITTNTVGCRDSVIENVTGFLCEPRSLESLIGALERVLQLNENEFINMKISARHLAEEKFDENINIKKYIDSIENK
ncbi:glycosyltransferase family 4 protein, partial [Escherichia coli]|nr:glycosyltransferase family 4 protein [Escherichia coli]